MEKDSFKFTAWKGHTGQQVGRKQFPAVRTPPSLSLHLIPNPPSLPISKLKRKKFASLTQGIPKLCVDLASWVLWFIVERDLWKILGKVNSAEQPTESLLPFTASNEPFASYQNSKGTDIPPSPPAHNWPLSEDQEMKP